MLGSSSKQSYQHGLRQRDEADFSEGIWARQYLPNSCHFSIICQYEDLPFYFIAAQFLLQPLVRNRTQRLLEFSPISLSTDLMTTPRNCNTVTRKDSPSKNKLGNLLKLLWSDTDAKYSFWFPILALIPLTMPFMSLLVTLQARWPAFSTWRACKRIY